MNFVTLYYADQIIAAAFVEGAKLKLAPLCVAVLDGGGHIIACARQDGASYLRPKIAIAKASGALGLGVSSRKIAEIAVTRPTFISSLAALDSQGLLPAAGGLIIVDETGHVIGAVGVSGDTSDNDELCGFAGIAAAGLASQ